MDSIAPAVRSRVMASVHSRGNRSTEVVLRMALTRARLRGWTLHAQDLVGVPDFWFRSARLAIFVDGCFWHGCGQCLRLPRDNRAYWAAKIARNRSRANEVGRVLRAQRVRVIRVWEHNLQHPRPLR